ncbi:MAG: cytochrome P450, partial [Acidimicrobiales bacterium]|nr:cytochrome P450 [Acidimicrobiales bacterium]
MSETGTTDTGLFFNPLDPGYIANPFPHLAELREQIPVHHTLAGPHCVFRYDDVFALLRDPAHSVDDKNADLAATDRGQTFEHIIADTGLEPPEAGHSILNIDPPDHTRLRRLVSKAFTPRTIEALRPRVQAMVDATLDRMAAAGQADLVEELAFPLPFDVISEMLGMPESDKDQIRDWSAALVKTLDPIITDDEVREALIAAQAMDRHIEQVIEWKRANPADDLLTAMIEVEEDGDRMSTIELRDQVNLLFVA